MTRDEYEVQSADFKKLALKELALRCDTAPANKFQFLNGNKVLFTELTKYPKLVAEEIDMEIEFITIFGSRSKPKMKKVWTDLHLELKDLIQKEKRDKDRQAGLAAGEETGFQLLIDKDKGKDTCRRILNTRTGEIDFINWHALLAGYGKELGSMLSSNAIVCKFQFDPYEISGLQTVDEEEFTYNTYTIPPWEALEVEPEMPEFFQRAFDHLFKTSESTESFDYFLKWIYLAKTERCIPYLVFNSVPGTGKGFTEAVCRAYIGWSNSDEPSSGFLKKEFNKMLENKRLLILDEIKVTEGNKDKLKRYTNNKISIEGKGKDAGASITNYCSSVISNNDVTDIYLRWNDRRFAVMNLTNKPLNSVIPDSETNAIVKALEEPDCKLIAQFGAYLKNKFEGKEISIYPPYKGEHFYHIVETSLYEWQKLILERFSDNKESSISVAELRRDSKALGVSFPANYAKINAFLSNYRHGPDERTVGKYDHKLKEIKLFNDYKKEEIGDYDFEENEGDLL